MTQNDSGFTQRLQLARDVAAPAAARRFAHAFVGDNEYTDVVMLLVSELVTNVIAHTNSDVEVQLKQFDDRIRAEVSDRGSDTLELRHDDGEGGRGLRLVEALANRWGVDSLRQGKTVWFEIGA
jgi:anti-sigma regulatory factor (Ser/Thr protein kinase)